MSDQQSTPRFGADLITFYDPAFWQAADDRDLAATAAARPEWFWTRLLDSAVKAGLSTLELTFPPGDWRTALAAFGSADGFRKELDTRGLSVLSGFFVDISSQPSLKATDWNALTEEALEYAELLSSLGCSTMVAGLPMRTTRDTVPPMFVDLGYASTLGGHLNDIAAATLRDSGVRLALHTEAHSVFWTPRDIDLFMIATDPLYVGFCPDTGHIRMGGSEPASVAERHLDRIAIAHWKDASGTAPFDVPIDEHLHHDHQNYFRRVGAGSVDWAAWAALMSRTGLHDDVLLEVDAVPDPVAELTAARTYIQDNLLPVLHGSTS
ncbi:sugar phosphate isomerase/epimerase family protein [Streptomyces sp. NPDC056983]|uniref:sugar phosphate isomerase/epimerase family protein n=1 Tax=Streptomyces sp. NPDC056983 TaxID=3345987 RepID=UPI00363CE457